MSMAVRFEAAGRSWLAVLNGGQLPQSTGGSDGVGKLEGKGYRRLDIEVEGWRLKSLEILGLAQESVRCGEGRCSWTAWVWGWGGLEAGG